MIVKIHHLSNVNLWGKTQWLAIVALYRSHCCQKCRWAMQSWYIELIAKWHLYGTHSVLCNFLKHLGKLHQTIFKINSSVKNNAHKSHFSNPYCVGEGPCVCMKVITVGFDVVVCPEFSSFRSGSGCSTPLILHMGNPAVIRIGRAGGEIDFICRIIDVTEMQFVWNIKSHFRGYG